MTLNSQSAPPRKKTAAQLCLHKNQQNSAPPLSSFTAAGGIKTGGGSLSVCVLAPGSWCDHGVRRRCGRTAVILNHSTSLSQAQSTRRSLPGEDYNNLFRNPEMFRRLTSSHRKSSDFAHRRNGKLQKAKTVLFSKFTNKSKQVNRWVSDTHARGFHYEVVIEILAVESQWKDQMRLVSVDLVTEITSSIHIKMNGHIPPGFFFS